jgi:hypothetical protein
MIALVAMLSLVACAAPAPLRPPAPAETPTPLPDEFHAEMLAMRTQWRRQGMPHYRIHFEFIEDANRPALTYREVFIGNYAVRGVRCAAGPCPTSTFKDVITVTDVFALMQRIPQRCINQVKYDPYLFYPAFLSADCAEDIAHPFALRITRLEILN